MVESFNTENALRTEFSSRAEQFAEGPAFNVDSANSRSKVDKPQNIVTTAAKNGEWTPEAGKAWQNLTEQFKNVNGATEESVLRDLRFIGREINDQLKKTGSEFRVGQFAIDRGGKTEIYMSLSHPGTDKEGKAKAILEAIEGKNAKTVIKAGEVPKEKPAQLKSKPRGSVVAQSSIEFPPLNA